MTFCLNQVISPRQGEAELSALMVHFQAENKLAAAPGRLSINHMYEEWCLRFAGYATELVTDSLGPTETQVAAFLLSLCSWCGLASQVVKASVSAEPGQKYP